jgi:hypothetical protein
VIRSNLDALMREVTVLRSTSSPLLSAPSSVAADVAAVDTRVRVADLSAEITTLKALYESLSQRLSQKADASEVVVLRQRHAIRHCSRPPPPPPRTSPRLSRSFHPFFLFLAPARSLPCIAPALMALRILLLR